MYFCANIVPVTCCWQVENTNVTTVVGELDSVCMQHEFLQCQVKQNNIKKIFDCCELFEGVIFYK